MDEMPPTCSMVMLPNSDGAPAVGAPALGAAVGSVALVGGVVGARVGAGVTELALVLVLGAAVVVGCVGALTGGAADAGGRARTGGVVSAVAYSVSRLEMYSSSSDSSVCV